MLPRLLERFLFTPDMQYSPIGKLSGGEKQTAVSAGCSVRRNANVLLLDERGEYRWISPR